MEQNDCNYEAFSFVYGLVDLFMLLPCSCSSTS